MKSLVIILFLTLTINSYAQLPKYLQDKVIYPVLNENPYMGVYKLDAEAMTYDKKLEYKVAIDVYSEVRDSTRMHLPFIEAARTYNLNIANGVPQDKLNMAVVIHGSSVDAILNDEAYKKRFGISNPNMELLNAMKDAGINFYVCGQNLGFLRIPPEDVIDLVDITLSAKTTFIILDQRGYTYMDVNEE